MNENNNLDELVEENINKEIYKEDIALERKNKRSLFKESFQSSAFLRILIFALIAYVTATVFAKPFVVSGNSMFPNYKDGEFLISAPTNITGLHRFDVVTFKNKYTEGNVFIKRVIGLPGDTVQIKNKNVYINNKLIKDPVPNITEEAGIFKKPITLKEDEYVLLGDNRPVSHDCRDFGPVQRKDIKYKILVKEKTFKTKNDKRTFLVTNN